MPNPHYSILIVGIYCHPSHVIRFIRNLKLANPSASISLLTDREPAVYLDEIHGSLAEFIKWRRTSRLNRIPFMNRLVNRVSSLLQIRKLEKVRHYDIINIHYPQPFLSYLMKHFRRMSTSIVISPWGSDVLRLKGKRNRRQLAKICRGADWVTVGPNGDIGKTLVSEMKIDKDRLHPLAWGSETIDYINDHIQEVSDKDAKQKLGLENRYVITCGYNAFKEQRHALIIEAIREIRSQLPSELILLFPVTYGFSYGTQKMEYVNNLKTLCLESGLDAIFYENYLSVADLFYLRQATDMFVHIQTTDGGNSSLQEYVLCGKKVVHGSWLHYKKLEQYKPLFYYPVDDLSHLGEAILQAFRSERIDTPAEVLDYIRNRGWKQKMLLWNDFFTSIV